MPKFSRPGVEAAVRLSEITDVVVWNKIERQYKNMLEFKGGAELLDLDLCCDEISRKWRRAVDNESDVSCTLEELETIMEWKFSKGKPRPLWKHIRSNSEHDVQEASNRAFAKVGYTNDRHQLDEQKKRGAINEITVLKGIGPASASAILSLFCPEHFAFMDDEVIECLHPRKRAYSLKVYMDINARCQDLAKLLSEDWTPRRVGIALWTAAKLSASGNDMTSKISCSESEKDQEIGAKRNLEQDARETEIIKSEEKLRRSTRKRPKR